VCVGRRLLSPQRLFLGKDFYHKGGAPPPLFGLEKTTLGGAAKKYIPRAKPAHFRPINPPRNGPKKRVKN